MKDYLNLTYKKLINYDILKIILIHTFQFHIILVSNTQNINSHISNGSSGSVSFGVQS